MRERQVPRLGDCLPFARHTHRPKNRNRCLKSEMGGNFCMSEKIDLRQKGNRKEIGGNGRIFLQVGGNANMS